MHRDQQFSKFETYLKDRELSFKRSLSAIEQQGTEGALDRCRVLADQINRDLRDQKPGHFVNSPLLADFQLSLEHAASLLEENTDIHRQSAERPAGLGGDLQPPDPNSGLTAVGSPAAMSREKLFQRAWPRMMIGVMFVLEVVWIVLLVDLSIAFVRFAFLRPRKAPETYDRNRRFAPRLVRVLRLDNPFDPMFLNPLVTNSHRRALS